MLAPLYTRPANYIYIYFSIYYFLLLSNLFNILSAIQPGLSIFFSINPLPISALHIYTLLHIYIYLPHYPFLTLFLSPLYFLSPYFSLGSTNWTDWLCFSGHNTHTTTYIYLRTDDSWVIHFSLACIIFFQPWFSSAITYPTVFYRCPPLLFTPHSLYIYSSGQRYPSLTYLLACKFRPSLPGAKPMFSYCC